MAEKVSRSLNKDLEMQFEKQENCDVMFEVDGITIGAHKFMLQARNQILRDMVSSWKPGDKPVHIEDMGYDAFKAFLRFIYTDEISLSNENIFIFLYASRNFKMLQLEELCAAYISKSLSTRNVCIFMNEAVNFDSPTLQKNCLEVFSKQTNGVTGEESFLELSQPALSTLLDAESTNILEILVFENIKKWMVQRCNKLRLPVNGTNMRHVIGDALYKIRFPTMTVQDFANSVTTIKGLLTDTEMAQTFQMITVFDTSNIQCPFPNNFRCRNNCYYTPFNDMIQLSNSKIIYDNLNNQYSDMLSMVNYIQNVSEGGPIKVTSLRLILQCCADLANSTGRIIYATSEDKPSRNEFSNKFNAWQETAKTKNIHDILTKFMEVRTKLNDLCLWV